MFKSCSKNIIMTLIVVEPQVLHSPALVDELLQGVDADFEVLKGEILGHHFVGLLGLDAVREHRLVRHHQKGTGGNTVVETHGEECGGLHIHGGGSDSAEVLLELLVMLPHATVGGIDRTRPVLTLVVSDGGGDGLL